MKHPLLIPCLALLVAGLLVSCSSTGPGSLSGRDDPYWPKRIPDGPIVFAEHVKPLLEMNCMECHNRLYTGDNAGFILETRESALTTGRTPPAILPGDPDNSLLIKVLALDVAHTLAMPPTPEKVFGVRESILKRWIREGAEWPAEERLTRPQDWKRRGMDGQYRS